MESKAVRQSQLPTPPTSVSQSMFRTNRGTVGGYFLAGRNMVWWPVRGAGPRDGGGDPRGAASLAHPHFWPPRLVPLSSPATLAAGILWAWQGPVRRAAWLWLDLSGM